MNEFYDSNNNYKILKKIPIIITYTRVYKMIVKQYKC